MKKVFTNGCFDILHRGHIELFMYARSLGDVLYVGVDRLRYRMMSHAQRKASRNRNGTEKETENQKDAI